MSISMRIISYYPNQQTTGSLAATNLPQSYKQSTITKNPLLARNSLQEDKEAQWNRQLLRCQPFHLVNLQDNSTPDTAHFRYGFVAVIHNKPEQNHQFIFLVLALPSDYSDTSKLTLKDYRWFKNTAYSFLYEGILNVTGIKCTMMYKYFHNIL